MARLVSFFYQVLRDAEIAMGARFVNEEVGDEFSRTASRSVVPCLRIFEDLESRWLLGWLSSDLSMRHHVGQ